MQVGPPPERVAVAALAMPGGVPVTVSRRGITALDRADGAPVPAALVATTLNVYVVPLVRPAKVIGEAAPVAVAPPGLAVTVYPVIALPPVDTGAVNVTVASAFPALAVPMVGAPGATGFTVKVRLTWVAGKYDPFPAWSALIVQLPAVTNVSAPPVEIVHTVGVAEVNTGVKPESEAAVSVGVVPKFWAPGLTKVIVCVALGVIELEATDAGPVPATLSAVTVKV